MKQKIFVFLGAGLIGFAVLAKELGLEQKCFSPEVLALKTKNDPLGYVCR